MAQAAAHSIGEVATAECCGERCDMDDSAMVEAVLGQMASDSDVARGSLGDRSDAEGGCSDDEEGLGVMARYCKGKAHAGAGGMRGSASSGDHDDAYTAGMAW